MGYVEVRSPVEGYSGITAGVQFTKGVARVDEHDAGALAYFRRRGYQIGPVRSEPDQSAGQPADLSKLSRAELEAMALELGVEDPGELPNKAAVVEAIEARQG